MKHIDLFSGIGGFALATEMIWENVEHIFCDNEPFSQAVLAKHWPNSKIYGDIRTLTSNTDCDRCTIRNKKINPTKRRKQTLDDTQRCFCKTIDLLTGGFPCQPFSQAGQRRGTDDDRYLWPEMLRIIREFNPRWVIGENVGGLVTWSEGLVLEQIHADLESEGYEVQAFIIPAVSVNAPHRRDRVWIVAHRRLEHGQSGRNEGMEANSIKWTPRTTHTERQDKNDTNSDKFGCERKELLQQGRHGNRRIGRRSWDKNWIEVATKFCRVDDGIPKRLDRNPRLKGLGNAIVPQVAAEIMKVIKFIDALK